MVVGWNYAAWGWGKSQLGHFPAKAGFFLFLCLGSLFYKSGIRGLA